VVDPHATGTREVRVRLGPIVRDAPPNA